MGNTVLVLVAAINLNRNSIFACTMHLFEWDFNWERIASYLINSRLFVSETQAEMKQEKRR